MAESHAASRTSACYAFWSVLAIRPAVICGTSSGAIIGLAYAAGMTVDEMADVCQSLRWRQLVRPSVRSDRVFDTERLEQLPGDDHQCA